MSRVVVVTGTGTEVGKTWVTAATARALAPEHTVVARKPVQSFEPGAGPTDADVLAAATGQSPHDVCRPERWYPVAVAPPMAADILGRPAFTIADLAGEVAPFREGTITLVEGAGARVRRSRPTATPSTSRPRSPPTPSYSSPTRGSAPSTRSA